MWRWLFGQPPKKEIPILTTERLLYEAIDYGLISDSDAAIYLSHKTCYPTNWFMYNPNHYVRREQRLGFRDKLRFFLALMDYHITIEPFEKCLRRILYLPDRGVEYKAMLSAAVNKNIQYV
jgi:hypothetical protein